METRMRLLALLGLAALAIPPGLAQARPAIAPLALNQPVTGLSAPAGSLRYFQINVPRGLEALEIATGGGVGDCDLYVQPRTPPTLSAYYARSTQSGPVDRVRIRRPRPGPWFVGLHAATRYQGVGLRTRAGNGPVGPVPRKYPPAPPAPTRLYPTAPGAPTVPHASIPALPTPPSAPSPRIRHREDLMTLDAPAGGQTLYAGQTMRIAWRSDRRIRRVRVEFSADDGKTFGTYALPTNLDARRGEAYWRIPAADARFITSYGRLLIVSLDPAQGHFPAAISGRFAIRPAGTFQPPTVPVPPARPTPPPPVVRRAVPAAPTAHYRPGRGRDPYENNDSRHRPSTIQLGQAQTHTIYPDEDEDWLVCPISGPGRYVVQFTRVTVDEIEGEVFLPDRHGRDDEVEDFEVDEGDRETVRVDVRRPVRYLKIRVRAEDDDENGAYTIRVLRI